MSLEMFNKSWNQFGSYICELKRCKGQLKRYTSSQILMFLVYLDKDGRGYLTKKHLQDLFSKQQISQSKIRYFDKAFPNEKISYTLFITYLTRGSTPNIMQNQLRRQSLEPLIKSILTQEQAIEGTKSIILQNIPKFIPITGESLTIDELTQYSLSQCLNIDPSQAIFYLNSCHGESDKTNYKFFKANKEMEDSQPHEQSEIMNRLKNITERLAQRVNNFGKQWLSDK